MTSSVSKIPKDHTSDLIVNLPYRAASGAVHLMGNFAPAERTPGYSSGRGRCTGHGVCEGKARANYFHESRFRGEDRKEVKQEWAGIGKM